MPLNCGCEGSEYLSKLEAALAMAHDSFQPQLVLHNAGSDILENDPLGRRDLGTTCSLSLITSRTTSAFALQHCLIGTARCRMAVSAADMLRRDAMVFEWCRSRDVPVCMLLSGGYAAHSAAAVAASLQALCSAHRPGHLHPDVR